MENSIYRAVEVAIQQTLDELLLVEIVGNLAIHEIPELLCALEIIDRNDPRHATFVERLDDVRSDKSGCTGDNGVHDNSSIQCY